MSKSPREDTDNAEESDEVVEPSAAAGLYNFDDSTESKSDEDLTSEAEEEPPKKQSKQAAPMSAEVLSILPKDKIPKKQGTKYISYGIAIQGGVATTRNETEFAVPGWLQGFLKNQQAVKTESTQLLANKALDNAAFSKYEIKNKISP